MKQQVPLFFNLLQLQYLIMWAAFWAVVLLYIIPASALQALLQVCGSRVHMCAFNMDTFTQISGVNMKECV